MRSLGQRLLQGDWCSYEKEKFRHREKFRHAWGAGGDGVKRHREKTVVSKPRDI